MDLQIANLPMPVAALLASLIGAAATITATLIQLRMAWRRELQAREKRQPVTSKARRGPVAAIVVLLVASAVGGFALAQYLASEGRKESQTIEADLRARLDQLSISAQRLEQASLGNNPELEAKVRRADAQQRGAEGSVVNVNVAACHGAEAQAPCSEHQAQQLTLCAELPATATVTATHLFARDEEGRQPWTTQEVQPGEEFDGGRFTGAPAERLDGDDTKQVCQTVSYWNSDRGRALRLIATYTLP